jgi:hypothetical protein
MSAAFELRVHPTGAVTRHHIETLVALPRWAARGRLRAANQQTGAAALAPNAWPSVIANWRKFNTPFEGVLPFMYTDSIDLVTTGMGNLVDASQSGSSAPWAPALSLPWRNADGSLADQGTVIAQWQAVKNGPVNSSVNAGPLTTIRLDDDGIQQAIDTTLSADINTLQNYYPTWESLPADAQLAILSMAWAMGAGFPATFVQFTTAINEGRFDDAAGLSDFQGIGVSGRIAANKFALHNAQLVVDNGLDPSTLYWPNVASASAWLGTAKKIGAALLGGGLAIGGAVLFERYGDRVL